VAYDFESGFLNFKKAIEMRFHYREFIAFGGVKVFIVEGVVLLG